MSAVDGQPDGIVEGRDVGSSERRLAGKLLAAELGKTEGADGALAGCPEAAPPGNPVGATLSLAGRTVSSAVGNPANDPGTITRSPDATQKNILQGKSTQLALLECSSLKNNLAPCCASKASGCSNAENASNCVPDESESMASVKLAIPTLAW